MAGQIQTLISTRSDIASTMWTIPMNMNQIERPTLLVDKSKVLCNVDRMARKARASSVTLRPHFKTHQSAELAEWLREFGILAISVSSVDMADYFSRHGWEDITVAAPVNIHQIPKIDALAKVVDLHVIIDSEFSAAHLARGITGPLNVWIEIDTGDHRTGIPAERIDQVMKVAGILGQSTALRFKGLLTHGGHSYRASGVPEIVAIHGRSLTALQDLKQALEAAGYSQILVSIGDTPSCTMVERFMPPIDEIRPGNFVFYDLMQLYLGVCREEDIAVGVACPVISKNTDRDELVIYGGSIHVSRESLLLPSGRPFFGQIARLQEDQGSWTAPIPDVNLISLSQEHGKVTGPQEFIRSVQIGETLIVLPIHSCITASLYSEYRVLKEGVLKKYRP
jgi:D-serine deaminase-like pyridoxal phosphate-dependent protein